MEPPDETTQATGSGETAAGQTHRAALDPEAIRTLGELVGGDLEALHEIARAFLEDAPERIRELHEGLTAGDDALVRRSAHTLKSTALTFGASDLGEACRELEEAARTTCLDDAELLVGRVEAAWARAQPGVEDILR